ncbi:armadillo repeat-containing protein 1 isoform X5 [Gadus morhua]|uniref:armadillo repeat-containing protein 1 isoform X5 n=1 Tax=Gadus morhua TaxID=8049 RepID=UPI0011B5BDBC|nr:armadillo repeat-containing protein 1 isoform X5 [Gadus morhua]
MLSLCCHVILGDSSLNNPTSHPHSPCGRRSRNARVVFFCGVQVVLYLEAAAAMSGEAEALLVVNQLRDLAADPMNRRAIVQDQGCLPGLILFLDHPNPQVVYSALLALRYLAECRANREKMEGELGMMLSLQNVIQKSTTPGETKLLASEVYELLQASSGPESDRAEGAPSGRRKAQFFLGSTNKRAKTVVLHIDGLDDSSRRTLCEEALLKIRGVISFTFQMAVKRCIVRIRSDLKAEALASAIASTEVLTAQQVVKGENGQEILIPFTEDGSLQVEQNVDLPDYLPEEEAQAEEPDKAVTRVGNGQDGATWLGTAANFLSRSFYW